jgi:hypothetical protein
VSPRFLRPATAKPMVLPTALRRHVGHKYRVTGCAGCHIVAGALAAITLAPHQTVQVSVVSAIAAWLPGTRQDIYRGRDSHSFRPVIAS